MSKNLRAKTKSQNNNSDVASRGDEGLPTASGAAAASSAVEGTQSPTKMMLLLWGIPLLLVVAALVLRSLR